jgi:hypothetical protein
VSRGVTRTVPADVLAETVDAVAVRMDLPWGRLQQRAAVVYVTRRMPDAVVAQLLRELADKLEGAP